MKDLFIGAATLLGIIALVIVLLSFNGKKVPFISDGDKGVFISIFVIGLVMCGLGMTRDMANINWLSPYNFIAYIFGAAALFISIMVLAGHKLPFISGYRQATISLIIIMALKWLIVFVHDKAIR